MNQLTRNSGFTLIELMLSMTFVAVLLLTIALSIVQMSTTYNRGMTMKEVNQVARDISDDLRTTVSRSSIFAISPNGTETTAYVTLRNSDGKVVGGRFCTGVASYIWNTSYGIERRNLEVTKILDTGNVATGDGVRLYKVNDSDKRYCARSGASLLHPHITAADGATGSELLKVGDRQLGVQDFTVIATDSAEDAGIRQKIYTVQYRIGTGATEAMNTDQTACLEPGQPNSNWTYCNVQQFAIVVRAGNARGQ